MAERCIRRQLWGYQSLISRFFDDVQPVLTQAREERIRAQEEASGRVLRKYMVSPFKTRSRRRAYNKKNQDKSGSTSSSRQIQSRPSGSPEITFESLDVTEIDGHQESQAQPVDHSSSSDAIPLPTASEDRECIGITTEDPTDKLDGSDVRERSDQQDESWWIQESPTISENASVESHIVKGAEE